MNSIMSEYFPTFQMYQALRDQLMTLLTDEDLRYRLGGTNPTLGALCREMGEVEVAYIQSFKTFKQDFTYRNMEPGLEESVTALATWFAELDRELQTVIEGLSEKDITSRTIDRGGDFRPLPFIQLECYKEALLIFYGKVSVYLKAMGKTFPEQWQEWIG
ncbi:MAG: hypothetical protein KJ077_00645 [Anaerolineae bacterium]|nr:hypothetical protein [Anaerolineae bacterium]